VINFKPTAPSRLYWAGRPATQIVQALHWLHDILPADEDSIMKRIRRILDDRKKGAAIRDNVRSGLDALLRRSSKFIPRLYSAWRAREWSRPSVSGISGGSAPPRWISGFVVDYAQRATRAVNAKGSFRCSRARYQGGCAIW
jgi:hypothetical protein